MVTKSVVTIIAVLFTLQSYSQIEKKPIDNASIQTNSAAVFRLFSTQNMWTFIKLNTRTGQMWQVQFDVQGNNRFLATLNPDALVTTEKEANDRFTLYSTQNIYSFILLDQIDGKTWQVQWSKDLKNRFIIPIE